MSEPSEDESTLQAAANLHLALQLASSWAHTHLTGSSNHRRLNFGWQTAIGAFVGREAHGIAVGVRLADQHLVVLHDGQLAANHPTGCHTPEDLLAWIHSTACELGVRGPRLERPDYTPPRTLREADTLPAVDAGLARQFGVRLARASELLQRLPEASAPRCWPRDLDITVEITHGDTLLDLRYRAAEEPARWTVRTSTPPDSTPDLALGQWDAESATLELDESELPPFGAQRALAGWLDGAIEALQAPQTASPSEA